MTVVLSDTARILTKAKVRARAWMPYLSHVLGSLRTYLEPRVPTMAVDEYARLYVNEDWVRTLSVDEVAYVLLHEVLHVVLSHSKRRKSFLPEPAPEQCKWWNVAADLCIQQMLARHHRKVEPKCGVKWEGTVPGTNVPFRQVPGLTQGMSTEKYYSVLWDWINKQPKAPPPVGPGRPPKGGEGDQDSPIGGQPGTDPGEGEGGGDGQAEPTKQEPLDPEQCGSSSDGIKRDYERKPRLSDHANVECKLRECEKRIAEMESKGIGNIPGELKESLEARLHPQPDPFDQLRNVVSRSVASPVGSEEYTYRKLCRRQPHNVARLRGVVRVSPECSVIVDTSGSMSCGNIRDKAMTAVAQGLRKVQRPRVVCFDTQVQDAKRLSSMKDFQWCGNGGTDMATACEQEDREQRPDAIVLITDGETDYPATPTRARLIIALCDRPSMPTPSWAKVVRCYEEGPKYAG